MGSFLWKLPIDHHSLSLTLTVSLSLSIDVTAPPATSPTSVRPAISLSVIAPPTSSLSPYLPLSLSLTQTPVLNSGRDLSP